MWQRDHELFEELAQACGSRYLAVNYLAHSARKLSLLTPGWIIESKLITWALTGEAPDLDKAFSVYYMYNPDVRELDDFLCYIEDPDVRSSVKESYHKSIKHRHLLYVYKSALNESQKSRVRVLMRMFWFEFEYERS